MTTLTPDIRPIERTHLMTATNDTAASAGVGGTRGRGGADGGGEDASGAACEFRFVCCQMPHECREQAGHTDGHRTHDHEAHAGTVELPPFCDCGCHSAFTDCGECCYVAPGSRDTSANSDLTPTGATQWTAAEREDCTRCAGLGELTGGEYRCGHCAGSGVEPLPTGATQ